MKKEKREKVRQTPGQKILRLTSLATGAAIGVAMIIYARRTGAGLLPMYVVTMLLYYLAAYTGVIIHELGHMLGGLMSGYTFRGIGMAGLILVRDAQGKLRRGRSSLPGAAGQCMMTPPPMQDGQMKYKLYLSGGWLANLIAAILFLMAAALVSRTAPRMSSALMSLSSAGAYMSPGREFALLTLRVFAIVNIASVLNNALPLTTNLLNNDGSRMRALGKSKAAQAADWRNMMISSEGLKGVKLKDMPSEWFVMPSEAALQSSHIAAAEAMMCYSRLHQEDRDEEANALCDRLLGEDVQLNGAQRATLRINRSCQELIRGEGTDEERREKAEGWLDAPTKQFIKALRNSPAGLRIRFCRKLLLDGNEAEADRIEAEYDRKVRKDPTIVDHEWDKRYFVEVRKAYEQRKAETANQ